MEIRVLGAHNSESKDTRYICLLIDGVLAVDAGCLTSSLTFEEQTRLQAVLLTHGHYDHIRDIPALAINLYLRRLVVDVYTHRAVYNNLTSFFLNGEVYSEFYKERDKSAASLNIHIIEGRQPFNVGLYQILPVPVNHSIATLGYQVSSSDGGSFFYTGDTGTGLSEAWASISARLVFIEVTSDDKWQQAGQLHGHLTPALLKSELIIFKKIKGYLPKIVAVHMNPADEPLIRSQLACVASEMEASIDVAFEGMLIKL